VPGKLWRSIALVAGFTVFVAAAPEKEVHWPSLNPGFEGATFVNDPEVCASCHDDATAHYERTAHAQSLGKNPRTQLEARDCESCHGPRSEHVDSPDDSLSFERMTAAQQSSVCLQCHASGQRMHWRSSAHTRSEVSCTSCHTVMEKKSETALLASRDERTVCYSCHAEVRGKMQKVSRHPVREGKMTCSDCHNAHGSPGQAMLARATVNETCYGCHADKRGPFVWEHAPVRESCSNCHDAHGSNNRSLMIAKSAFQCMQCHQYGGHINLPRYNRVSTLYGQGCVNCHVTPHGSNHPSGAKLTR
jgi:DmsE family decaheme c-type cytochrome